jgi:RNA polymerase sigma factor (sigma-70 family)
LFGSKTRDAELVERAAAGNREAMAELYSRHFDSVYDFLRRMMRDADEAADVTQDVFVKAMTSLSTLKKSDRFRTWLFSIAHNAALNRIERGKRIVRPPAGDDGERDDPRIYQQVDPDRLADPERSLVDAETVSLVWEAAAGLEARQYALLDLHVRKGLDSAEIAEVMGVSKGNAYTMVSRLKSSMEESVAAYLMMRRGRKECAALDELLIERGIREMTPETRRLISAHISNCPTCGESRKRLASPLAVLGAFASIVPPLGLKGAIFQRVAEASAAGGPPPSGDGGAGAGSDGGGIMSALEDGSEVVRETLGRIAQSARDTLAGMPRSRLYMLMAGAGIGFGGALFLSLFAILGGFSGGGEDDSGVLGALSGPTEAAATSTPTPAPSPTVTAEAIGTATPTPKPTEGPTVVVPTPTSAPTATPTPTPAPPPPKTPTPTPTPVPDTSAPAIGQVTIGNGKIWEDSTACADDPKTSRISAPVSDNVALKSVIISWKVEVPNGTQGSKPMAPAASQFVADIGPFGESTLTVNQPSAKVALTITATDMAGNQTKASPSIVLYDSSTCVVLQ